MFSNVAGRRQKLLTSPSSRARATFCVLNLRKVHRNALRYVKGALPSNMDNRLAASLRIASQKTPREFSSKDAEFFRQIVPSGSPLQESYLILHRYGIFLFSKCETLTDLTDVCMPLLHCLPD